MKLAALAFALALTAFVALHQSAAAADPVVTDMRVEAPDTLTVGDRVRYVIELEADAGTTVFLAPGTLPEALSLAEAPEIRTRSLGDGRIAITITLELAAFLPGELLITPLQLRYVGPDGATGQIETPASRLDVTSVLPPGGDLSPRDLKPQAEISATVAAFLLPALIAACVALVIGLGLLVWRLRRPRPLPLVEVEAAAIVVGPEDDARAQLDRAGARFGGERDHVAYYETIAVTVRGYLTERFGFPAFALTTSELQDQMIRRGIERWQARLVSGLLAQCDAVVFARYRPAFERADADLTAAYEIVEMSRPKTAEPEEVASP